MPDERSLSLIETEQGLIDALAEAVDSDDETALAICDAWLTGAKDKRDAYARAHFLLVSQLAYCDEEMERIKAAKQKIQRGLDKLHERALFVMERTGQKRLEGHIHTLTARPTKGATVITDETLIPPEYFREKVTRTPDKTAIRAAIELGIAVPGADVEMPSTTLLVK